MKTSIKVFSVLLLMMLACAALCSCKKENANAEMTGSDENINETTAAEITTSTTASAAPVVIENSTSSNSSVTSVSEDKSNYIEGDTLYGFESTGVDFSSPSKEGTYYLIDGGWNIFVISGIEERRENEDYKYIIRRNGYVEIERVFSNSNEISIPSEIDGKKVAYIGANAIKNKNVKRIILPDGIFAIGNSAFSELHSLESVSMPESVMAICMDAFYNCENLKDITFPKKLRAIGDRTFMNCSSIEKAEFSDELVLITREAFNSCKKLAKVDFGNNLMDIYASAFENTALTEVVIPDSIHSLCAGVFSDCEKLKKVVIPKTIGDTENGFGWGLFEGCISLETVSIPENLTGLPSSVFCYCRSLKSITIPASIESMGSDVFSGCTSLKDIYFESKDCGLYYNSFLLTPGLKVHAPKGGTVEEFFFFRPLVKFVATD